PSSILPTAVDRRDDSGRLNPHCEAPLRAQASATLRRKAERDAHERPSSVRQGSSTPRRVYQFHSIALPKPRWFVHRSRSQTLKRAPQPHRHERAVRSEIRELHRRAAKRDATGAELCQVSGAPFSTVL